MLLHNKKVLFGFLITLILLPVTAQRYTISGYVKDNSNGEMLIGANVFIKDSYTGTVTNSYGFYSLSLKPGNYSVVYQYLGYDSKEIAVDLNRNMSVDVGLETTSDSIEAVIVTAERDNENIVSARMSSIKITSKVISQIPVILGETDVIKTLTLLPGVKATGEVSSSLSIRGGARDQNMLILDEATVYNASHLGGFFSVFNNDAIKNVELYKGNIPSRYGGRLSSLIDVRMKDGNNKRFSANGGIGLLSSRLTIESPVVKDKGSLIISGRRTYYDVVMKILHSIADTIPELPVHFYDLNMKANYTLSEKHRLFISGYLGRDAADLSIGEDVSSEFSWGNYTATLRWNYIINRRLFSNLTLMASNYDYEIENMFRLGRGEKEYMFRWKAYLKDYSAKLDLGYYLNPYNTLRFGMISSYHDFNVGKINGRSDTITWDYRIPKIYCIENAIYISNEQRITDKINVSYGLRYSALHNIGKATIFVYDNYSVVDTNLYEWGKIYNTYSGLEPRLGFTYVLSGMHSIKLGYTRTRQYLQIASNSTSGTPLDIWIPSSPNVKPQIADQYSIGYFRNFKDNSIKTSVELYYKNMQNQVDFKEFAQPYLNPEIEGELRFGKGKAYGLEFMVEKPEGRLTGWISYTLSRSERKTRDIQEKGWYTSPYDIPHDISVVASYKLTRRILLSANWVYQSGRPVNAPVARWEYGGLILPYFPGRNTDRMPAYHRMDIGLELSGKLKSHKRFESSLNFSIYNLYNRKNANTVYFIQDYEAQNVTKAMKVSLFRFMPSVTYNFKF
jgi:outer membrane receptor for ferrienterochelin and colicin